MNWIPKEVIDDLFLFTLAGILVLLFLFFGEQGVAEKLASGLFGAIFMYVKGKA